MLSSWSELAFAGLALLSRASATILQNGQVRFTDYPDTRIDLPAYSLKTSVDPSVYSFNTYPADAKEISYKGRWDSNHVSWWS
jgi:hypothetical protein